MKQKLAAYAALVVAAGVITGSGVRPRADTYSYASQRRQIKAGVLVVGSIGSAENSVPHLFYILDRRTDMKPAGWEFVNPLAPGTLSGEAYARWKARTQNFPNTDPAFDNTKPEFAKFHIGSPLTKDMGAYWEVSLDNASVSDLRQFDVLLMAYANAPNGALNPTQREKLRSFVDSGGTLWLENEGQLQLNANNPFVVDVVFNPAPAGSAYLASRLHSLVNFPMRISPTEVANLSADTNLSTHAGRSTLFVEPNLMSPVLLQGGQALLSAGEYGAGHLVVSSAAIASGVNNYAGLAQVPGEGRNSGAICGQNLFAARPTDLKLAYNIAAWTSTVPTAGVNARRANATKENLGAALSRKWSTIPNQNPGNEGSGAVIHKGVIFYVDSNKILHAYDASPGTDLDGDLNPDDGIVDFINGTPYDEIWNYDLTKDDSSSARFSTPTIITVTDTARRAPLDMVVVTGSQGTTLAYLAFPTDASGRLAKTTSLVWAPYTNANGSVDMADAGHPIPSPAYVDGVLFTISYDGSAGQTNFWHVAPLDPGTGNNVFGNKSAVAPSVVTGIDGLPALVGSLTCGYVKDEVTGALDRIVYTAGDRANANAGAGSISGLWFSTRNEPLTSADGGLNRFHPTTRERRRVPWYAPAGLSGNPLLPVLNVVNSVTGVARTRLYFTTDFTVSYGPPNNRDVTVILNAPIGANETLIADYTLDWLGANVGSDPVQPGDLRVISSTRVFTPYAPNAAVRTVDLTGAPALSDQDVLYFSGRDKAVNTLTGDTLSDRVYALHDQLGATGGVTPGRPSATTIDWSFSPHNGEGGTLGLSGALKPRLLSSDPFAPVPPIAPQAIYNFKAIGSPAIENGVVYVAGVASMAQGAVVPQNPNVAVVLALKARPSTTFSLNRSLPPNTATVSLQQIDFTKTQPGNRITLTENLNLPTHQYFTVDVESGTIHILNMRTPGGESFNTALPIYVQVDATPAPDPVVNPATGHGPLDNLLWFTAIPLNPNAGNLVPAGSPLRDVLATEMAAGMTINVAPASGPTVHGDALFYGTEDGRILSLDMSRMPSDGGQATLFVSQNSTLPRVRLRGALIDDNPVSPTFGYTVPQRILNPPVGTANTLAVSSTRGLAAFDNHLTLIADNNRLIEVNAGAEAVWSADTTRTINAAGGALNDSGQIVVNKTPLNRPTTVRLTGPNEYLIADSGNNRIVQADKGGNVVAELHSVTNDLGFLRPGDPLTLNSPTDVQVFTNSGSGAPPLVFYNSDTGVTARWNRPYYAVRYVIADSGNFRLLEVVDIVDDNNQPIQMALTDKDGKNLGTASMLHQVIFVSRSLAEQNAQYRYRTIQQFQLKDPKDATKTATFLVSAIDNVRPGTTDLNSVLGADGGSATGPGGAIAVIRRTYPSQASDPKDGSLEAIVTTIAIPNAATGQIIRRQPITNPTFFRQYYGPNGEPRYLLADAGGVYVLRPTAKDAVVEWMLSSDDYYFLTGRPLRAASLQRLENADVYIDRQTGLFKFSPHFLITNSYSGVDQIDRAFGLSPLAYQPGEIQGEVFEIRGADYYRAVNNGIYSGYRSGNARLYTINNGLARNPGSAIVWMVPNESIKIKNLQAKIQRSIGSIDGGTTSYLLQQPTFADRPY